MAEEQKHTPGPWRQQEETYTEGGQWWKRRVVYRQDGKFASPATLERSAVNSDEELEANAHLISAAPELLKACELMVDAWSDHHGHHEPGTSECDEGAGGGGACPYCRAQAAIAKSQGGIR